MFEVKRIIYDVILQILQHDVPFQEMAEADQFIILHLFPRCQTSLLSKSTNIQYSIHLYLVPGSRFSFLL